MSMSNYLELKILDHVLRNVAYTSPTTVYLSLHTTDPGEDYVSGEVSEASYARQAITNNAASTGSISNSADILFPVAAASWGTITHIAIWDAVTAGNMLFSGALSVPKAISASDQFKVAATNLTITLD